MKYGLGVSVAVALATACGGATSNGSSSTTGDAGGGGTQDSGQPAVDAGDAGAGDTSTTPPPPDDGPWPADHYPIAQFQNLGGTVLAAPKLVTVTFAGDTFQGDATRDALRAFDDSFAEGTPWWSAVSAGYNIGAVTAGGHYELPDTVSNTTLDDDQNQIQQKLVDWVTSGALPTPDANTVFALFFPASTTITFSGGQSCGSFGGYHSAAAFSNGTIVATYLVIPDCAPQGSTAMQQYEDTISHELIEAATDPHPGQPAWYGYNNAWFRAFGSTVGQGEVADVCQRYGPWTDAAGNWLARSWDNAAAAASHDPCQPSLPGEIYYGLAIPTVTQPSGMAGVPDSDGYVVVKRGETKTLDAVFFSDAKLPNDAQVSVGQRSQTTINTAFATGITTTVTPAAAHNGMHVSVTFQVDSTAAAKDYTRLVARSTVSSTDHHDWPFILRVQ